LLFQFLLPISFSPTSKVSAYLLVKFDNLKLNCQAKKVGTKKITYSLQLLCVCIHLRYARNNFRESDCVFNNLFLT
jgi:hypothetical protein